MEEKNSHPLFNRLKARAAERVGKLVDFPVEIDGKIKVATKVWVQPLFAFESDMCKVKAGDYCKGRFKEEDQDSTIDAQNVEALVYAYRDADDHNVMIFHNAQEIRNTMTFDEIALLIHQLNIITYSLSSWKIVEDKKAALELAKELADAKNTELIDLMHATELARLVLVLSTELEKLKNKG